MNIFILILGAMFVYFGQTCLMFSVKKGDFGDWLGGFFITILGFVLIGIFVTLY